jgi:hypothetical protein
MELNDNNSAGIILRATIRGLGNIFSINIDATNDFLPDSRNVNQVFSDIYFSVILNDENYYFTIYHKIVEPTNSRTGYYAFVVVVCKQTPIDLLKLPDFLNKLSDQFYSSFIDKERNSIRNDILIDKIIFESTLNKFINESNNNYLDDCFEKNINNFAQSINRRYELKKENTKVSAFKYTFGSKKEFEELLLIPNASPNVEINLKKLELPLSIPVAEDLIENKPSFIEKEEEIIIDLPDKKPSKLSKAEKAAIKLAKKANKNEKRVQQSGDRKIIKLPLNWIYIIIGSIILCGAVTYFYLNFYNKNTDFEKNLMQRSIDTWSVSLLDSCVKLKHEKPNKLLDSLINNYIILNKKGIDDLLKNEAFSITGTQKYIDIIDSLKANKFDDIIDRLGRRHNIKETLQRYLRICLAIENARKTIYQEGAVDLRNSWKYQREFNIILCINQEGKKDSYNELLDDDKFNDYIDDIKYYKTNFNFTQLQDSVLMQWFTILKWKREASKVTNGDIKVYLQIKYSDQVLRAKNELDGNKKRDNMLDFYYKNKP